MPQLRPCTLFYLFRNLAVVLLFSVAAESARSDEPFVQFLEGLRERKYFDTALIHIDDLAARADVPQDIKDTLELERGMTYRALGAASRVPEDREQALGQAEVSLRKFVAQIPNHPRAAYANAELGQLLFDKARSLIWDAESPSNAARKVELQDSARTLIQQAKSIYQAAHDQYKAQFDTHPFFIDRAAEPEAFLTRERARVKYLRAWFNLVRCSYERGQTFDMGTKERANTLIQASKEFEAIHTAYRENPIGLQARLMMGKCFQEQDDINRALGIYNQMLDNTSTNSTVMMLKALAVQYRLICLNHPSRNDYQLVIQEASTWSKDRANRALTFTETGLGILWEKAVAEEKLGKDRTLEPDQQKTILRQALADSKQVAKFPGPYRETALAMGRRLKAELGDKDGEPQDFDTAFERARGMVGQLKGLNETLKVAQGPAAKEKAQQAIDLQLNEIGRLFKLALDLREEDTDAKAMAQARYLLSYVFMRQRKSFDAIILAKYSMTRDRKVDPDSALGATAIAIESAVQAFNDATGQDQSFELDLLKDVCETIIAQYPSSAKGNEARIRLGQVYRDLNQPLQAAKTYLLVPNNYSKFSSARIQAGQAYWLAWLSEISKIESGKDTEHTPDDVAKWKADAETLLVEGLTIARQAIGDKAKPTTEMTAAEVSLATILNMNGQFAETIQRLTAGGENSVLKTIEVPAGQSRPDKGVQSPAFAGQMYRLLLRSYVGTQQIEPALQTMELLKGVGGQDTAQVYTELGRELQQELERLKASGDKDGFQRTQASFTKFLEEVNKQRDPTDYNSLLWIGETYFGLGQGVKEDPVASVQYIEKAAAAYQNILDNNLAEGATILAIKLRQVRCLRATAKYEQAFALAESILAENALSLDVQFEAAHTLADWGSDPNNGQPGKLLVSIEGIEVETGKKAVWGWSTITSRLAARQSTPEWATLEERFMEARYELTNSRFRYAKTGPADAADQFQSAQGELVSFAMAYSNMTDSWFDQFNNLFKDVRAQQGLGTADLPRPAPVTLTAADMVSTKVDPAAVAAEKAEKEAEAAKQTTENVPPEETNYILVTIALALAAGGGFAVYRLMSKPPKKRRSFAADGSFTPPTPGVGMADIPDLSGVPDFSSLGAAVATAAPVRAKKSGPKTTSETKAGAPQKAAAKKQATQAPRANAPTGEAAAPSAPGKKRRVATPEEAAKIRAARAAKAKALAAKEAAAGANPSATPPANVQGEGQPVRRKVVKKKVSPPGDATPQAGSPPRKVVRKKKRPPEPPPVE